MLRDVSIDLFILLSKCTRLMLLTSILKTNLPGGACPRTTLEEVRSAPHLKKIALYPCLHLYAVSWLSSLHCNSRWYTVYVRVGSVAFENSTLAPGTLMGNPTCLSTLYETSSYPTAPPKDNLWRRHWPRHITVLCALPWKSYALSVDLFWSGLQRRKHTGSDQTVAAV